MAKITDYGTLKTAIRDYLKRDDLSDSDIEGWIQLCGSRLNTDLDAYEQETSTSADITSGEATLPSDFGTVISVSFDVYRMPPQYEAPQAWHEVALQTDPPGTPRRYTIEDKKLKVKPYPDKTANVILVYLAELADFSSDTDTNDVLTAQPGAYLYGSLLEGMPWIGNDPRSVLWGTMYQERVEAINKHTRDRRVPRGAPRITMSVRPVRTGRAKVAQSSS